MPRAIAIFVYLLIVGHARSADVDLGRVTDLDPRVIGVGLVTWDLADDGPFNDDSVLKFLYLETGVTIPDNSFWARLFPPGNTGETSTFGAPGTAFSKATNGAGPFFLHGAGNERIIAQQDESLSMADANGNDIPFTITIWKYRTGGGNGSPAALMVRGDAVATLQFRLATELNPVARLRGQVWDGDADFIGRRSATDTTQWPAATWIPVAMTYSGASNAASIELYRYGVGISTVDDNSGTYNGMSNTVSLLDVGAHSGFGTRDFAGRITVPVLYTSELSTATLLTNIINEAITNIGTISYHYIDDPHSSTNEVQFMIKFSNLLQDGSKNITPITVVSAPTFVPVQTIVEFSPNGTGGASFDGLADALTAVTSNDYVLAWAKTNGASVYQLLSDMNGTQTVDGVSQAWANTFYFWDGAVNNIGKSDASTFYSGELGEYVLFTKGINALTYFNNTKVGFGR